MRQKCKNDTVEVVILPFLAKKPLQPGVIVKERASDAKPDASDESDDSGIEACAEDLISAVHAKDVKGVAEAIKSAFELLGSAPEEKSSDIEPHSYTAQNQKANESV